MRIRDLAAVSAAPQMRLPGDDLIGAQSVGGKTGLGQFLRAAGQSFAPVAFGIIDEPVSASQLGIDLDDAVEEDAVVAQPPQRFARIGGDSDADEADRIGEAARPDRRIGSVAADLRQRDRAIGRDDVIDP